MDIKEDPGRITVFRTATDENTVDWLYKEVIAGRLRQGWGWPGLGLMTSDGERVEKSAWEEAYRACCNED